MHTFCVKLLCAGVHVYLCIYSCIYPQFSVLWICRALLQICRALLQICRALLQICRALLLVYSSTVFCFVPSAPAICTGFVLRYCCHLRRGAVVLRWGTFAVCHVSQCCAHVLRQGTVFVYHMALLRICRALLRMCRALYPCVRQQYIPVLGSSLVSRNYVGGRGVLSCAKCPCILYTFCVTHTHLWVRV